MLSAVCINQLNFLDKIPITDSENVSNKSLSSVVNERTDGCSQLQAAAPLPAERQTLYPQSANNKTKVAVYVGMEKNLGRYSLQRLVEISIVGADFSTKYTLFNNILYPKGLIYKQYCS